MHGAQADLDSIGRRVALAEFVQGEVDFLPQEDFQEQFALLGHHSGTTGVAGPGRELPRLDKKLLEALYGRRTDVKHGGSLSNRMVEGMVKQPDSEIQRVGVHDPPQNT